MEFDEKEFEKEMKKKILERLEAEVEPKKIMEEMIRELTQQLKEAKSEDDLEVIEKKIEMLKDMLKGYEKVEGDKDIQELKEVMSVLSESLPKIMDSIFGPIKELINEAYDPDKAEKFGKNVANFYKELVAAGMDPDKAFELTKEYMESMNIVKTLIAAFMKEKMGKIKDFEELKKLGKKKLKEDFEEEL
ncbi:hypothetical protein [Thermococcus paralvinellae]|uniref:Uncharacterized protein n=1 Tax=Thermococcus paralvinellae TaxID=582419 RepID=W0I5T4_9EURY|nr:hypothetical protein [Thermococcus paralvinellae]AHF80097.1 Hypothetical protein TES1_0711 [Thermococcus paralvinellae]